MLLWVVPALWSSNHLIARLAYGVLTPHVLALGRWLLAVALMLPFVGAVLWRQRAALRREWRQLMVLGVCGMWICGGTTWRGRDDLAKHLAGHAPTRLSPRRNSAAARN